MSIKAIETRYRGYRFRSRLEARWAVFFDALGLEWEYEPQGFEANGYRYLPDFRIASNHGAHWWVEVKGDPNWLKDNVATIEAMHDWAGILDFRDCGETPGVDGGLIVLGNVPHCPHGILFVPVIGHRKGVNLYWRAFAADSRGRCNLLNLNQIASLHLGLAEDEEPLASLTDYDFQPKIAWTPLAYPHIGPALDAARGARFEHGESGARSYA